MNIHRDFFDVQDTALEVAEKLDNTLFISRRQELLEKLQEILWENIQKDLIIAQARATRDNIELVLLLQARWYKPVADTW